MMNGGSAFKKVNPLSLSLAVPPVKTLIRNQSEGLMDSVKTLSLIIRKMDSDSDIKCTAWLSDSGVKK